MRPAGGLRAYLVGVVLLLGGRACGCMWVGVGGEPTRGPGLALSGMGVRVYVNIYLVSLCLGAGGLVTLYLEVGRKWHVGKDLRRLTRQSPGAGG